MCKSGEELFAETLAAGEEMSAHIKECPQCSESLGRGLGISKKRKKARVYMCEEFFEFSRAHREAIDNWTRFMEKISSN
jgi:hypothetical protein